MSDTKKKNPYRFMQAQPRLGKRVFIAEKAWVSGSVTLSDDVSIWPMAVLRGDVNRITVGARCNIQDSAVLHVTHEGPDTPDGGPLVLAEDITVGHGAILHACTIEARCLVGMGAIVMDRVYMEEEVMVAAGSVVTPGTTLPRRTLWKGNPARLARDLTVREVEMLAYSARHYVRLKDLYLASPPGSGLPESGVSC